MNSITRRNILKYSVFGVLSLSAGVLPLSGTASARESSGTKALVLYYSRSGNTEALAKQIHSVTGGDIARLDPASAYPADYDTAVEQGKREQNAGARPAFKPLSVDINTYDIIFLGHPLWWGTMPMFYFTFLEANPLAGKTVASFCTYGSSGLGHSVSDIRRLCPAATVLEGYGISGRNSDSTAQREISNWLNKNGLV